MSRVRNKSEEYSFIATGDLTGKAGYAVALDTSNVGQVVLANAQTLPTIGILYVENQLGVTAGSRVTVILPQRGTAPVVYGGDVTIGAHLTPTTSGKLIATTTNKDLIIAEAIEAGHDGEVHEAVMTRYTLSA